MALPDVQVEMQSEMPCKEVWKMKWPRTYVNLLLRGGLIYERDRFFVTVRFSDDVNVLCNSQLLESQSTTLCVSLRTANGAFDAGF